LTTPPDTPVLLITGASSGIGAAVARAATEDGFRVALAARDIDALVVLAAELGGSDHAIAVGCDVREFDELQAAVARTREAFGARLDAVFANAGVGAVRGFRNDDLTRWRAVVETNILGTALTIRACAPALTASGGQLVLMGSVYGRSPVAGSLYSASKRAVAALAESARLELGPDGVRVTLIEAGTVDTPFFDNPQADALLPGDVARAVLWALGQPPTVEVSEIVVRATAQGH
jgi:NADP-dependent 3-hydroxy acid dehydrogenase YdfG